MAGTSLEESAKKVHESQCKKNNSQQSEESKLIARSNIVKVTGLRSLNSHDDYDEADEEGRRRLSLTDPANQIMKTPALRTSKYWQFPISLWLLLSLAHRWQCR